MFGRSSIQHFHHRYQEIFTDPPYAGQIVVLTNPEIGNYGTSPEDQESGKPYIEGLIVREFSRVASNGARRKWPTNTWSGIRCRCSRISIPVLWCAICATAE